MDRGPPQKLSDDGWGDGLMLRRIMFAHFILWHRCLQIPERQRLSHMDGAAIRRPCVLCRCITCVKSATDSTQTRALVVVVVVERTD